MSRVESSLPSEQRARSRATRDWGLEDSKSFGTHSHGLPLHYKKPELAGSQEKEESRQARTLAHGALKKGSDHARFLLTPCDFPAIDPLIEQNNDHGIATLEAPKPTDKLFETAYAETIGQNRPGHRGQRRNRAGHCKRTD